MDTRPSTVLVSGAGRGLGLETCRQLAQAGWQVWLASRGSNGERAARELAARGLRVSHVRLDVTDPASIAQLAAELRRQGTPLAVLVNNAAVSLEGFDAEVARRTLETNFFGALQLTEALLPSIVDGGTIVMVSSGMGELSCLAPALRRKFADPKLARTALVALMHEFVDDVARGRHAEAGWPSSAYSVSKAGLNALTRVLARELASRQIRVNAVCPGWVRTDMGGPSAPRSLEQGAASIVWAAAAQGSSGGFFRDGHAIPF